MNLQDLQFQIQRGEMIQDNEEWNLAHKNPWTLNELDRLHCFQAKMKYKKFHVQDERDCREFVRLVKIFHNTKLTANKFWAYYERMTGC